MNTNDKFLTPAVLALFDELARDAGNWSGMPLFGGNVADTPANKGHLVNLKKAGLVTTDETNDVVNGRKRRDVWVVFTVAGKALAKERGIEL